MLAFVPPPPGMASGFAIFSQFGRVMVSINLDFGVSGENGAHHLMQCLSMVFNKKGCIRSLSPNSKSQSFFKQKTIEMNDSDSDNDMSDDNDNNNDMTNLTQNIKKINDFNKDELIFSKLKKKQIINK